MNPRLLDALPLQRLLAPGAESRAWHPATVNVARRPTGVPRAVTARLLPTTLVVGFAVLAFAGLAAAVSEVVGHGGNVSSEAWLRLALTGLLFATVAGNVLSMLGRSTIVREATRLIRDDRPRTTPNLPKALPLDLVAFADLARRARPDLGEAEMLRVASARTRGLVGLLSWWPLVAGAFVVAVASVVVTGYLLLEGVLSDGFQPDVVWRLPWVAFALLGTFAIWRIARRSWGRRRNRRRRRLLRRLLRPFGLGGRSADGLVGSGARSLALGAPRLVLVGLAASSALVLGAWSTLGFAGTGGSPGDLAAVSTSTPSPTRDPVIGGPTATAASDPEPSTVPTSQPTEPRATASGRTATAMPSATLEPTPTASSTPTTAPSPTAIATQPPTASPTSKPPKPTATAAPTAKPPASPPAEPSPTPTATPSATPAPTPCMANGASDADCDGVSDEVEDKYGSKSDNPDSTPEHADYDVKTCNDGKDNDGDGDVDGKDSGCA
jgi:hypothetical protein